jgi:hypothetical protein
LGKASDYRIGCDPEKPSDSATNPRPGYASIATTRSTAVAEKLPCYTAPAVCGRAAVTSIPERQTQNLSKTPVTHTYEEMSRLFKNAV